MPISRVADYDLLTLVGHYTAVRYIAATRGGEYHGPCPKCGGRDRLRVQPRGGNDGRGLWSCRSCHEGWGDAIVFVEWYDGVDFKEACRRLDFQMAPIRADFPLTPPEPCDPPPTLWQQRAGDLIFDATQALWSDEGARARSWLVARGYSEIAMQEASLGYIPADTWEAPALWGLPAEHNKMYIPRGVLIPWQIDGFPWRMNIRRPISAAQRANGEKTYIQVAGGVNALYNVGAIKPRRPVMMVEGELDALAVEQEAGDLVACVATGSTAGGRRARWYARLSVASVVLLSFDNDGNPGEQAAMFWGDVLSGFSIRWRPILKDASEMLQEAAGVREWVEMGIETGLAMTADEAVAA